MGLDITVLITDCAWLEQFPPQERLPRLRAAWYDDETGLWDHDAPAVEGDWCRPQGPGASVFAVYEFRDTCGSFKPHFWAGQRWEAVRGHVGAALRNDVDALLSGLVWDGPDGAARHVDSALAGDGPRTYGVLLARSPDSVRALASVWERARADLGTVHEPFAAYAAAPGGWVGDFPAFRTLLEDWGRVLTEAARRGWGVVGLSE
ncbi:hypothetical protein ACFC5H_18175 [Streptomyces rochei]|uniref:DUF1877 family protein n=1 Tax=Streptomyces vinaceusdrappus TaxID=67376 RepID=A0ABY6BMZ1_9ACTN|nr:MULTISPECIES: hypothetical protein [Streptomyces]KYK13478.1 hypothetical protein AUW26_31625 [Streptomyces sp. CC71]QCB20680.1 hypothetical protein E5N77_01595 [Streptomyces sp. SS52]RSS28170.1 hypothetical protein EF916_16315 [Streptomyces sp. WAC08452]UAX51852.1 hypothetical protein K5X85_01850 [Streptomyces sp. A144]UXI76795.1 hypothetical protein N6Q81_01390 [Streptomyces vinaceusdrappus]